MARLCQTIYLYLVQLICQRVKNRLSPSLKHLFVCWDKVSNEDLISYKDYLEYFAANALLRFNNMHVTNATASDTLHNVFIELQDRRVPILRVNAFLFT